MKLVRSCCPLCLAIVLIGGEAQAEDSLMVVVEPSNAVVTPDEVRAAIAAEIRRPVLAPLTDSSEGEDVLVVAVAPRRAVLTFRTRQEEVRRRSIELPAARKDQLKTIGWLAVNLVTNQVEDPLTQPGPLTAAETPVPTAAASASQQTPPVSQDQTATLEPPTLLPSATPAVVGPSTATPTQAHELARTGWSTSAFFGPRMFLLGPQSTSPWKPSSWRHEHDGEEFTLEVQRNQADWQLGFALDMGAHDLPASALAAFVGDGWSWGKLRLEGTAGLGVELTKRRVEKTEMVYSSTTGHSSQLTFSAELRPRFYGRGNITLSWQAGRAVALLLRLGLHITPDDLAYCYGAALLGLRVNIP